MFRNKEFKLLAAISVAVILVEAFLILNMDKARMPVAIGIIVIYVLFVIVFTMLRYRKIREISQWQIGRAHV